LVCATLRARNPRRWGNRLKTNLRQNPWYLGDWTKRRACRDEKTRQKAISSCTISAHDAINQLKLNPNPSILSLERLIFDVLLAIAPEPCANAYVKVHISALMRFQIHTDLARQSLNS
jgi:hypothetical protein